MTVEQAEAILIPTGVQVALRHRFAFDTGTALRLDNYAIINIFDDGRYYIQGENGQELEVLFGQTEKAWNPDEWESKIPARHMPPPNPRRSPG
jgi:hypothetical protein